MRKIQKILSGIFLGGVLLGGIGTGVALVEYSSLIYGGEKQLGEENLITRDMDYVFAPGEEEIWLAEGYWEEEAVPEEDEGVPEGTVRYVVTYNEKTVKPSLISWEAQERAEVQEEEPQESPLAGEQPQDGRKIFLQLRAGYISNDFALLMASKDEILRELKEKRIFHYDMAYITDLQIKVNPRTMPYVHRER